MYRSLFCRSCTCRKVPYTKEVKRLHFSRTRTKAPAIGFEGVRYRGLVLTLLVTRTHICNIYSIIGVGSTEMQAFDALDEVRELLDAYLRELSFHARIQQGIMPEGPLQQKTHASLHPQSSGQA